MVGMVLAPKFSPKGVAQRLRRIVPHPSEIPLSLKIGYFIWRAPAQIQRQGGLDAFLNALAQLPRPPTADVYAARDRIARLRHLWFRFPVLRKRNTCYMRALTLYRFLGAGSNDVKVHFGVEQPQSATDRLRGHAWVTINGEILEGPSAVFLGRVREVPIGGRLP